ncbi:MAG: sulfatase-like hydrolase/transferase, partial [Anaerolineales bacterium]|nr:sulfatase-like hydrolase/transferase [Anaerolineales bacterium]
YTLLFVLFMWVFEFIYHAPLHIWYYWTLFPARLLPAQAIDVVGIISSYLFFAALVYITFKSRWSVRLIYASVMVISLLVQYGYNKALSRFYTIRDLNTAVHSPSELWIYSIQSFFDWYVLIPLAVFVLFLILTRHERELGWRPLCLLTLVGIVILTPYQAMDKDNLPYLTPMLFLRETTELFWDNPFAQPHYVRTALDWQADTRPANNIVLIIDESVRGDHLSVNGYQRPTTSFLEGLADQAVLYNWGTAAAAATCSVESNRVMITGLSSLPDTDYRVYQNPLIFQYAKAMGYETHYYDAQTSFYWNGVYVSDAKYIDHWVNTEVIAKTVDRDLQAAKMIAHLLEESTGNFIVLNKKGVHFPYSAAYPENEAIWKPTVEGITFENPKQILNTYDNGLVYTVDNFFRELLSDVTLLEDTYILYTSDHGQTLSEHGEEWYHCKASYNEAVVPLILLTAQDLKIDTSYKASHFNIFTTLLDLMGVPETQYALPYPPSLLDVTAADSVPRHYLPGDENFFTGEVVSFDP